MRKAHTVARRREAGGGGDAALRELTGYRRLFVDALAPTHLPAGWSVEHRSDIEELDGDAEPRAGERVRLSGPPRLLAALVGAPTGAFLQGAARGACAESRRPGRQVLVVGI